MRSAIASLRRRVSLRHVLHHHVARFKAADQKRALVADHRREPIIFSESICRGARTRFLSESEINAADYFALLVKILERLLHPAVEHHPAINFYALLLIEVLGIADRRRGRVQITGNLIATFITFANL